MAQWHNMQKENFAKMHRRCIFRVSLFQQSRDGSLFFRETDSNWRSSYFNKFSEKYFQFNCIHLEDKTIAQVICFSHFSHSESLSNTKRFNFSHIFFVAVPLCEFYMCIWFEMLSSHRFFFISFAF